MLEFATSLLSHMDITTILVFVVVCWLTWTFLENRGLPPGPWGLPFIGLVPFMTRKSPEVMFKKYGDKYGPMTSFRVGSQLSVVLNDFESVKEVFVKHGDNFTGRPRGLMLRVTEDQKGVFLADGDNWKEHRRFALSTFRDYGVGKNSLEPRITEEIHYFLDSLAKEKGRPFDFHMLLGMSTANIICTLEFGRRFEYTDESFSTLRQLLDDLIKLLNAFPLRVVSPKIAQLSILESISHEKRLRDIQAKVLEFMQDRKKEHEDRYIEGSKNDYIDAYFTERNSIVEKTGTVGWFTDDELLGTLQTMFGAGTDTTTTTIRWAIMALLVYPEMQERIQAEIDDVIGMERAPTMSDKNLMVYTDAFLLEAQRVGSILPMSPPHRAYEDCEIMGYRIPKDTLMMSNSWAIHNDPKLWDQPELFKPERFINESGQVVKPEYLIPFGIGKRLCLGEPLARMELFLYFAGLVQRFTFTPAPGLTPSLEEGGESFFRRPKNYEVCAVERDGYHVTF